MENQQLIKKDRSANSYSKIFPWTFTDLVLDRVTKESLDNILVRNNFIALPYVGSKAATRLQVPMKNRRRGIWLSYIDYAGTLTVEYYNDNNLDDNHWQDSSYWLPYNTAEFQPASVGLSALAQEVFDWINSQITAAVKLNPEDLQKNSSGQIEEANRAYDTSTFSGLGYRILRKNIQSNKNILTQSMINMPNTVYEIRYDFDLNGNTINIPENCVLKFEGGSLNCGTIKGNNTNVENNSNSHIFKENLSTTGGLNLEELDIRWFGAKSDLNNGIGTDCSPAIQKALEWSKYFYGIYLGIHGAFYLGTPIVTEHILNLKGDRASGRILLLSQIVTNPDQNKVSTIYVKPGITAFTLKGFGDRVKLTTFHLKNIKFTSAWGLDTDYSEWIGEDTRLISSSTIGGPSRPGSIIECTISNFYKMLDLDSSDINDITQYYNLDIRRNHIEHCGYIFYFNTYNNNIGSGLITIENNILEQSLHSFEMYNLFGYVKIMSNLLEGSNSSIINIATGNLDLIGNYWEEMKGDLVISGLNASAQVRILQNSAGYDPSSNSPYRIVLKGDMTLLDYSSYGMRDLRIEGLIHTVSPSILLSNIKTDCYNNCMVNIPIQSVIFVPTTNSFKQRDYISSSNIIDENGTINKSLIKTAYKLKPNIPINVPTIKGKLNDFIYISFYKTSGFMTLYLTTQTSVISDIFGSYWDSGFCFIVLKAKKDITNSEVDIKFQISSNEGVEISNIYQINLTSASINNYNIGEVAMSENLDGTLSTKITII